MQAYSDYFSGKLLPYEYPTEKVEEAMRKLRKLYPWLDELKSNLSGENAS
jgi:hypothetical protein